MVYIGECSGSGTQFCKLYREVWLAYHNAVRLSHLDSVWPHHIFVIREHMNSRYIETHPFHRRHSDVHVHPPLIHSQVVYHTATPSLYMFHRYIGIG